VKRKLSSLLPPSQLLRPVDPDGIDMTLLTDSIRKSGLLVPLTVCSDRIVDGYRRWLVCKAIGMDEIDIHEVEGDPDELRIVTQTRHTEFGRDEKRALVGDMLAKERSLTAAELAHRLQWSPVEVESLAGVDYLVPDFLMRYRSGDLSLWGVWCVSRCKDEGQTRLLHDPGPDSTDLVDAAQALHREVRAARRRSMVSRPRGKGYNQIVKERDRPCEAGPELIKVGARSAMDGWVAALNWVLSSGK
jgi:hypothetical protein